MIFVTGGTGLVGIRLLFDLVSNGKKVRALKRKGSDLARVEKCFAFYANNVPNNLFSAIEWVEGDVLDRVSLQDAIKDVHSVYHAAAMISFHPLDAKKMQKINIIGTRNVVNTCLQAKVNKLCFVSSIAALGDAEKDEEITEETGRNFENRYSAYSISKFKSELEVWRGIQEGLNAVIVNPSVIIGASNWNKGSSRIFKRIARGMRFYTRGITGYVDVRDVSKAMIHLMESDFVNERFILNSENISYRQIFDWIATALNVQKPKFYLKPWMSEIVWRICLLQKYLLFSSPLFTKSMARSAYNTCLYSSKKIQKIFFYSKGIDFIPVKQSIEETAGFYKALSA